LGAAVTLAAQGKELTQAAILMALFGLGAGTPMLVLGSFSRSAAGKFRRRLSSLGSAGKPVFGAIVLLLGAASLAGIDKHIETLMVRISPSWLVDITSRY
jgi:cytochrome c biogenesis protein CcdA